MKIAIILNDMHIGGIPRACVTLMQQLLKYADVTLILANDKGELHSEIPVGVNSIIIPHRRARAVYNMFWGECRYFKALVFLIYSTVLGKVFKRWVKNNEYIAKHVGSICDDEFDCAIAFHGMHIDHLNRTIYNVSAKKKIAWIHGDHPFTGKHLSDVRDIYNKYDKILCVSDICRSNFVRDFPNLDVPVETFYCLLNVNEIKERANQGVAIELEKDFINILTVGRLSPEKGQDMIPEVLSKLNRDDVRWFLIGDGPDRERIEDLKNRYNANQLIFLGAKSNPYPYIKECDIYVQPSYSEAYSLTAFEAATFSKPIVITDVAGATELLSPSHDSIVVKPTVDALVNGIITLINDRELTEKIQKNISKKDFSNYSEVLKLINYIH